MVQGFPDGDDPEKVDRDLRARFRGHWGNGDDADVDRMSTSILQAAGFALNW